jgi:hypothetical protein
MERLNNLDKTVGIEFGVVTTENPHFLKFTNNRLYILNLTNDCYDIITISSEQDQILDLGFVELETEAGKTYYICPPPELEKVKSFKVNKYILYYKCVTTNVEINQIDSIKNLMIDTLVQAIGSKKLKLSCWPFTNLSLSFFLKNCGVEHLIVIYEYENIHDKSEFFLFDPNINIRVTVDDSYSIDDVFDKIEDVSTNGCLFSNYSSMMKKVDYKCERQAYNGSSLTSDSDEDNTQDHYAFVIFNPKTPTNKDDKDMVVLPISDTMIRCGYNSNML